MPPLIFNIESQIVVKTAAQWAADVTVYSAKRILVTSDVVYTGTDQRKWKLANGVDTWANLDYMPIGVGTLAQVLAAGNLVPNGVPIKSADSNVYIDFGNGNYLGITTDNNGYSSAFLYLDRPADYGQLGDANFSYFFGGGASTPISNYIHGYLAKLTLNHSTEINLDSPSVKKNGDEIATEAFAEGLVVGLWDDRGVFDASGGAYPSTGGSGTAGAILKGDVWTISVSGTLPTGQVVEIGDVVRALIDTPGNTQANWGITQNNIGYTAENSNNKSTNIVADQASNTKYPSVKAVYDWATGLFQPINAVLTGLISLGATAFGTTAGTFAQGNDSRFNRLFSPIHTITSNSHTGDTNETILFTSSLIAANTFLSGDAFMIKQKVSATSNGNAKTFRAYMNTVPNLTGSPVQIAQAQVVSGAGGSTMFVRNYKITASNNLVGSTPNTNLLTDEGNTAVTQDNITVDFTQGLYFILTVTLAVNTDTAFVRDIRSTIHRQ